MRPCSLLAATLPAVCSEQFFKHSGVRFASDFSIVPIDTWSQVYNGVSCDNSPKLDDLGKQPLDNCKKLCTENGFCNFINWVQGDQHCVTYFHCDTPVCNPNGPTMYHYLRAVNPPAWKAGCATGPTPAPAPLPPPAPKPTPAGPTPPVAATDSFTFSAGFSDDMVLQRSPAAATVYGFTTSANAKVSVTVADASGGNAAPYTVTAVVSPHTAAGGTGNGLCQKRCLAAGHCGVGQIGGCANPTCAMGCAIASRGYSAAACKKECLAAHACSYNVVTPAGPHHAPGQNLQNLSLNMCSDGPTLANGTGCGCNGGCELGCDFGEPSDSMPAVWKAVLQPHSAGGSFTITVTSTDAPAPISLQRVTFGDVYFCSGQSNMDLSLKFTFSKPALDQDVQAGKYDNIRLFMYGSMGVKLEEIEPTWVTTQGTLQNPVGAGGTWANMSTSSKTIKPNDPSYNLYSDFSATCFYFASSLTKMLKEKGKEVPPIGLIQSAVGGTMIEAWTPDAALDKCKNESLFDGVAPPARLYNGMVAPFVNMSLSGWLWYQGENNCGGTMGNSQTGYGYGCQLPSMIAEWRKQWSAQSGTTDPQAPFGVVTLAAGGSEGNDQNMAHMRWSQTGNYGALPNPAMPNTFLAHAYDLGDPMDNLRKPCVNNTSWGEGCIWPPASAWNPAVAPLRDAVFRNAAPSFMGGIHPRFKEEVGRRLAAALLGSQGPTLSGCSVSGKTVQLRFDKQRLGDDSIVLQWAPEQYNSSDWDDSSSMMICTNKSTDGDCLGDGSVWTTAPLRSGSSGSELVVDLSGVNAGPQGVLAIRYGWPFHMDTCCPSINVRKGLEPCIPGSCPIITKTMSLPANPWYADIVGGKCKCMAPQQCDE